MAIIGRLTCIILIFCAFIIMPSMAGSKYTPEARNYLHIFLVRMNSALELMCSYLLLLKILDLMNSNLSSQELLIGTIYQILQNF